MKKLIVIIPALALTACFGSDDRYIREQSELYQISMTQYQDYNCNQIRAEMRRLSNLIDQQTIVLNKPDPKNDKNEYLEAAINVYAIARGADMNSQQSEEDAGKEATLMRLKSQYNGLDQLSIQKDCMSAGK